jgi:DNA modification methylase
LSQIIQGNALSKLKELDSETVDCIVTDPPYGYSFMNKDWDKVVVSVDIWKQCLRVLKSGAFAFIMCAPRQDVLSRQIVNLQNAGFETGFTSIYWTYASGFPKAKNLKDGSYAGFQPKPAVEIVLVVMKPLSEKSYVDQALQNRHGITWLDDCRIPYDKQTDEQPRIRTGKVCDAKETNKVYAGTFEPYKHEYFNQSGRFPANLLVSDDVLNDGIITKSSGGSGLASRTTTHKSWKAETQGFTQPGNVFSGLGGYGDSGSYSRYFDLDKWFETTFPFAIIPKPSKREKNMGLDKWIKQDMYSDKRTGNSLDCFSHHPNPSKHGAPRQNFHPTVKPLKLMSYLITLGSREGDTILDPFCGSGTTLLAAQQLRRDFIGIDLNPEYIELAKKRLDPLLLQAKLI